MEMEDGLRVEKNILHHIFLFAKIYIFIDELLILIEQVCLVLEIIINV
jgi:hypothetical protein